MQYKRTQKNNVRRSHSSLLPYVLIILFSIIIMYPQIHHHAFIAGLDSYFHMNRFYESAMQIKTGHFSYFQSLFSFRQTDRIVNAMYGPIFSYIAGAILLISKSWINFQIITSFLVLIIAGGGMYHLAKYNQVKTGYAIVIAFMYMTSEPISVWLYKQQFTGLGSIILPFLILVGTKMIREKKIPVVQLSITMAILLQTHLLSSILGALALIPFVFITWIITKEHFQTFKNAIYSVLLTLLLTANVWGGILGVYRNNSLIPTFIQDNMIKSYDAVAPESGDYLSIVGIVGASLMIIVLVSFILRWYWLKLLTKITTITGFIFAWLSSVYFPWNQALAKFHIIGSVIQFPKRFIPLAEILLLLAFGLIFSNCNSKTQNKPTSKWSYIGGTIICFGLLFTSIRGIQYDSGVALSNWQSSDVLNYSNLIIHKDKNSNKIRQAFTNDKDLSDGINVVQKDIPDYLPTNSIAQSKIYESISPYRGVRRQLMNNNNVFHKSITNDGKTQITWNNNQIPKTEIIPAVKYADTTVNFNGKQLNSIKTTNVGAMKIKDQTGKNTLTIGYNTGKVFKIMSLATVVGWLLVILYTIFHRKKKGKSQK